MAGTRKTPKHWIETGLKALRMQGPSGLRAESLARELGATKGSFYWHFKDMPTFQTEILAAWRDDCLGRFETTISKGDTEVLQLRALAHMRPSPLDRSVRAWGEHHAAAGKMVKSVDQQMLTRIAGLLAAQDATHPDFPGLILASILAAPAKGSHTETLIDLLLVLK